MSRVAPQAEATGGDVISEEEAALVNTALVSDKPLWVYVEDEGQNESLNRKIRDVVLAQEKIGVGSKFFKCVKVSAADAERDPILSKAGKKTPRMIFMDRQFKVLAVLQGRQISQGKLKAAMGRVVGKSYKNKFRKMTREYIKLLNLLDRLDSDRRNIDTLRARAQGESGKASRRKLEKKLAKKQGEYDKEMQEWEGRENKLLAFRLKGQKKVES